MKEETLIIEIAKKVKEGVYKNSNDFANIITSFVNSKDWAKKANELYSDIATVGQPVEANKDKVIAELKEAEKQRLYKEIWKELKGFRGNE